MIAFRDVCGMRWIGRVDGHECLEPRGHGGGCLLSRKLTAEEFADAERRMLARYEGRLAGEGHDPGDEDRGEP